MEKDAEDFFFIIALIIVCFVLGWWASYDFYGDINKKVKAELDLMEYCYQQKKYDCWRKTSTWPSDAYMNCIEPARYECTVGEKYHRYREEKIKHDEWFEKLLKEKE